MLLNAHTERLSVSSPHPRIYVPPSLRARVHRIPAQEHIQQLIEEQADREVLAADRPPRYIVVGPCVGAEPPALPASSAAAEAAAEARDEQSPHSPPPHSPATESPTSYTA